MIKVFRFTGSKNSYIGKEHYMVCDTAEKIEENINNWIINNHVKVCDIKVNTIETRWHNNGGYNSIDLIYTIIYQ